jgi:hypothetical protein
MKRKHADRRAKKSPTQKSKSPASRKGRAHRKTEPMRHWSPRSFAPLASASVMLAVGAALGAILARPGTRR